VKQLIEDRFSQSDRAAFESEVALLSNLRSHSNIVLFLGACIKSGFPLCLVTEFMASGNLLDYLQQNKSTKKDRKIKWIKEISAGMEHLHNERVIHRDLAARNILLTADLVAKISDFGMSRFTSDTKRENKTIATVGPLKWMSPENLLYQQYSAFSDVWSFGVLLFEIIAESVPYENCTPTEVATRVVTQKIKLELPFMFDPTINQIFENCLQFEATDRPTFDIICSQLEILH